MISSSTLSNEILSNEKQTLLSQLYSSSGSTRRSLDDVKSAWSAVYSQGAIEAQRSSRAADSAVAVSLDPSGRKGHNGESKIDRSKSFRFNETVMHYSYNSRPPSKVAQTFQSLFSCRSANALDPISVGEPLDLNGEPRFPFKVKPLPTEVRIRNRKETQAYYKKSPLPCQCAVPKTLIQSADKGLKTIAERWGTFNAQCASLGDGREMTFDILSVLDAVLKESDLLSVDRSKQKRLLLTKMVETKTLANNGIKLTPKQAELYSGFCKMNVMELHSLAKSVLEIRSTVEALLYHADQLFEESGIALEALNKQLAEEGSIEQGNIEEGAVHVIPSLSSLSSLSQSSNDSERYRYPAPEESQDADPYEGVYWVVEALEYTAQSAILLRENVSGKKVEGRLRDIVAVDAHKLLDGKIESKGDQRSVGALANGLFKALHKRSTDLHEKVNELNKVATSSEQSIAA